MATQIPLPEGSSFAYEVGIRSLDEQLRTIEALDSKAGILVGNLQDAVGRNRQRLLWKARFLTAALVLLFAAVTLLGGYAMGAIASGLGGG